jgi:N-acetylglucosaminyldiphosphoundecaprenol N-acetyl-beta-D-mannosaminyltransferase
MNANPNNPSITDWIQQRTGTIFGFRITPTTQQDLIDATKLAIRNNERFVIAHQNLHGLYVSLTNQSFADLHASPKSLIHIDGFPLVYLAWLHGMRQTRMSHRAAVHDWLPHYARAAAKHNWRVFCIGSNADVNVRAINALKVAAPGLVADGRDGYFDTSTNQPDNQAVLEQIVEFQPDVILVGMGMPRQEQWILDNADNIDCHCIIAVGACLEYMAGEMQMSPRWMGPFGLEMVWRLFTRPRRYAHRYLVEPWLLLGLLIKSGRLFGRVG